ncbi:hypothetical protein ZWY2020_037272 [Hordeum vulgare]|nr:hypothetical protein ZWY2020_037272 [Hordeum vulgare]
MAVHADTGACRGKQENRGCAEGTVTSSPVKDGVGLALRSSARNRSQPRRPPPLPYRPRSSLEATSDTEVHGAKGRGVASPAVPWARAAHNPEGPEHQRHSRGGRGSGGGEGEEDGLETDEDGRICPSELAAVSCAIAPSATESAGSWEVASKMDELDTDRDGYVDLGEFAAFHGHGRGECELDAELRDSFDVDDINGDGRISDTELSKGDVYPVEPYESLSMNQVLDAHWGVLDDEDYTCTAGKPIYSAIISSGIDMVMVVVIRYFGGIKIGTGGLVRAYGGVASECLKDAPTCLVKPKARVGMEVQFDLLAAYCRLASRSSNCRMDSRLILSGKPIYSAIISSGIDMVMVVVIRYFGGIKIGTDGLVRAYGGVASECLKDAPTCFVKPKARVGMEVQFDLLDRSALLVISSCLPWTFWGGMELPVIIQSTMHGMESTDLASGLQPLPMFCHLRVLR